MPQALQTTLEQLRAAGNVLFLVTGRRFQSVALGSLAYMFAGAVLLLPARAAKGAGALGGAELAAHLHKLSHRALNGEALRAALVQRVTDRYQELHALR